MYKEANIYNMEFKTLLRVTFSLLFLSACTNEQSTVELSLTMKNGFGPFPSSMRGIRPYAEDEKNPWKKTHLNPTGIPEHWSEAKYGHIETNILQSVYQNVILGNISKTRYEELQKTWNWVPDTLNLSEQPVKTKIAFACGKDSTGQLKMIVDTNNNLDLSDDKTFKPIDADLTKKVNNDSLALKHAFNVSYERYMNNKIVPSNAPVLVKYAKQYNLFWVNFPQHAETEIDGEIIYVSSDNFANLSYEDIVITTGSEKLKHNDNQIIKKNEYIKINEKLYKNLGVTLNKNVLTLERVDQPAAQLRSTQVGFKSFPFEGNIFNTQSSLSLEDLKGKYVLLDFWAVWCSPCIKELPNLKKLYRKTDRSNFEIVGIVGDSPGETLEKMIEDKSIQWPQIVSDDLNKIKERFGVTGYPTTFLIDPSGTIIAKNLRGKNLYEKVLNLLDKDKRP